MKDNIQLIYVVKRKEYKGEIKREEFLNWMKDISERFKGNNEISTKLVELIPEIKEIKINKDNNEAQDDPFILYYKKDGKECMLRIKRCHHIIWGFLNYYCENVMK